MANGTGKFSHTIWLTGLPKSGKAEIALGIVAILRNQKIPVVHLEEEELKETLSYDLGRNNYDRDKHILRMIHVCYHITANGILNIASSSSAKRKMRNYARNLIGNFSEIYVKCPVDICIERDNGEYFGDINLKNYNNLIGTDIPYEEPTRPQLILDTEHDSIEENIKKLIQYLKKRKIL